MKSYRASVVFVALALGCSTTEPMQPPESVAASGTTQATAAVGANLPVSTAEEYQQVCGICHLDAGQGVPGAFPPLDDRLAVLTASDAGRDFLVGLLVNGLYGPIEVHGVAYAGAMPPMVGQLDSTSMAGLLNFVLTEFAQGEATFTSDEIDRRTQALGSATGAELRKAIARELDAS